MNALDYFNEAWRADLLADYERLSVVEQTELKRLAAGAAEAAEKDGLPLHDPAFLAGAFWGASGFSSCASNIGVEAAQILLESLRGNVMQSWENDESSS